MPVTSGGGTTKVKKAPKPKAPPRTRKDQGDTQDIPSSTLGSTAVSAGTSSVKNAKKTDVKKGGGATDKAQQLVKGTGSGEGGGKGSLNPRKSIEQRRERERKSNTEKFGFQDTSKPSGRKKLLGGTSDGGGTTNKGHVYDRNRTHLGIPELGANDDGRLGGAFRDRDLVGSQNDIEEFDGSAFSGGGFDESSGGGGGSGSSLAGRESIGRVGQIEGQSLEEVVYGVKKRGRKVGRARGE